VTDKPDLDARLHSEQEFHDRKYTSGDELFPKHYALNPTAPLFDRMLERISSRETHNVKVLEYGCGEDWTFVALEPVT
jgi:hypothetical protein